MKVTCKFVILFINLLPACGPEDNIDNLALEQAMDSIASVKIDSAYKQIKSDCDTAQKYRLPILVDSFLHADTIK